MGFMRKAWKYLIPGVAGMYIGAKVLKPVLDVAKKIPVVNKIAQAKPVKNVSAFAAAQIVDEVLGVARKIPIADKIIKNTIHYGMTIPVTLLTQAATLGMPIGNKSVMYYVAKGGDFVNRNVVSPITREVGLENIAKYNDFYSRQYVKDQKNIRRGRRKLFKPV